MSRRLLAGVAAIGLLGLGACTDQEPVTGPTPPVTTAAPTVPSASSAPTTAGPSPSTSSPSIVEPTTTNTLPPPPRPSKPAASTSGNLSAKSLPVPRGWKTVVRAGGSEEGFEGNGTWVRARDPRYAAHDVIVAPGCASVTRDDYPDPAAAIEGSYQREGQSGIGVVLQFSNETKAKAFSTVYTRQVQACTAGGGAISTKIIDSERGLIDERTDSEGDWTEVGALHGTRLTLIILGDPGHRISKAQSESLLAKIASNE